MSWPSRTMAGNEALADGLEAATNAAIAACSGDVRTAVRGLIIANAFLEEELTKVSYGYDRGRSRARQ